MKFGRQKTVSTDIKDYYSIHIRSMWEGLKQESAAFWWLCVYVFFEYVRPQKIYPIIDFLPWAQVALLLAIVMAYSDRTISLTKNPMNTIFVLFYGIVFLSMVSAFKPAISWEGINTVLNWVIIYFLITSIVTSEKRFFIFILLFLLVSFKMSQHGFRSFAMRGFSFSGWGVSGAPGWFQNSGEFGIQMVIFTPLSLAFVLALREYWGGVKRFIFYMFPITGIFSIIATSSRGALLGTAVVAVWFIVRSRVGIKALFGVVFAGLIIYSVIPSEFKAEFETMGEDSTSVHRLELWEYGLEVVRDHPLLGIGYNNWIEYCYFVNEGGFGDTGRCHEAHNTFIEAASELGIIGFAIFVIMVVYILKMNARSCVYAKQAKNKFLLYTAYGLNGGTVGLVVSAFFISVLFYPFFWFQIAMTVALHEIAKKQADEIMQLENVGA